MTEQPDHILGREQIQSALEVLQAYLAAPKNQDGRTPMEVQTERDHQRIRLIEDELKPLLKDYLSAKSTLSEFKTKVDGINKRNEFWGFKGVKGQMFFNMIVNVADDSVKCDQEIKASIKVPTDEELASRQIKSFSNYVTRIGEHHLNAGGTKAGRPKPGSVPFFLSYFWQIQERDVWPVFYGNRTSQSVTRTLPGGAQQTLTTSYTYDPNGRLIKTTYPDNSTTQTAYNSLGQQVTTTDTLIRQTSYQYDPDGHVTQASYPDNTNEQTVYDNNGNRTQFFDRTGVQTIYTYDALNRLTQSQRGSNANAATINKTSYDAIGQVLTTTDPNNNVTTYAYDDAGRRSTVTDALSHVTTFGYDAVGNQTSVLDANSNTTSYTYDNANRRTQVTYPDGKFETTGYDALGRVTSRTDAKGLTTQYGYDALGRLTSVTDALNQVTSYGYDEVGNRITQTDANTHSTGYNYDQRGRRTQRTLPMGQTESYTYDAAGNVLTRTDFNGKTTTYTYDAANRLLTKTPDASFNAPPVVYTYNSHGQRFTMTDASGTTTWNGYDNNGHPTSIGRPLGQVGVGISYTYDKAGNLTQISGQTTVNYGYDALNRLSTVQESSTGTTTYGYDKVGNLQTVTYPNGVVHTYSYDTRNRLTNLGVAGNVSAPGQPAVAGPIASYGYTLDASGHRIGVTELSGRTVSYGYDNLYRLTSETIASDPNGVNGLASYTYDPVGNRKQLTSTVPGVAGGLTNYNANDQIATDTYDGNGNTTQSAGLGYVYDFENHLIQAGAGVRIVYDGDGNGVSKTVGGVTTNYLVDTQNPTGYAQVLFERFSGASGAQELTHNYVYGLERISESRSYFTGTQTLTQQIYYDYDGHGSVRALTDPTGAVTDTYDYDAFGNLLHSTGSTPNLYLYSGEQFDPDLNLYYNRARYLNTSTGRFWNMDSYEGFDQEPLSLHKYLYAEGDAVNLVDPTGRFVSNVIYGNRVHFEVTKQFLEEFKDGRADESIDSILGADAGASGVLRPDLVSPSTGEVYEIASVLGEEVRFWKLVDEVWTLNKYDPLKRNWRQGTSFVFQPPLLKLDDLTFAIVEPPLGGVIVYNVVNAGEIYFLAAIAVKSMMPQLETETGTALTFAAEGVL